MLNDQDQVTLSVNGHDYAGWQSVSVTAGIERQARDFHLSVAQNWPDAIKGVHRITSGDKCELWMGQDKVLTGYVDATPISYDAKQIQISIKGRSKTADLIDCSALHPTGQWRHVSLAALLQELAAPYQVKVIADTRAVVREHQIQQGETVFESMDRVLRMHHYFAMDNAQGELVLIEIGSEQADTGLVLGQNIYAGQAELDSRDRFSEYICYSQRAGNDNDFGQKLAYRGAISDTDISRRRVLISRQGGQTDPATCNERLRYERAQRKAKSLEARYTVIGWRQNSGALWQPNMCVYVNDSIMGWQTTMLIIEVEYRLDQDGTKAFLKLGPIDGYLSNPAKPLKRKSKKTGDDLPIDAPLLVPLS